MNSSGDEDDKFLYGSDSESKVTQHQEKKRKLQTSEDENKGSSKKLKASDSSNLDSVKRNEIESNNSTSDEDESGSASSDEESDSDVEFIISTGTDTTRLDSASTSASAVPTQTSGISVATAPVENVVKPAQGTDVINKETSTPGAVPTGTIDLEAEGTFEGQPITSLDPEVLKEKPWRQPGANLSDYFNYGFNEFTWIEYLHRQEKLQPEYNPHKILMGLLALQQQGKLNGPNKMDSSIGSGGDISNNNGVSTNMPMNQHGVNRPMPPPGFPPLPMFGGFSPFGMPGMMPPMNQNQQNQQKK